MNHYRNHGQWIYRNIVVHDRIAEYTASKREDEIQMEIEKQQEMGEKSLLEEDKYLMEIKLDDLENSSGEQEEYWLLAILYKPQGMFLHLGAKTPTMLQHRNRIEMGIFIDCIRIQFKSF